MKILPTPIADLYVVESTTRVDNRGLFARFYCDHELIDVVGARRIVQINYSRTIIAGTVRGLHYQSFPCAEMKLVRCVRGSVWDVAVDLRPNSSTYLSWHAEELSPENARMVVIPEGFAHGFQALEPESELLYLHTASYTPSAEGGVRYDDPILQINWPLAVTDISSRDASFQLIDANFQGIHL